MTSHGGPGSAARRLRAHVRDLAEDIEARGVTWTEPRDAD